LHYVFLPFFDDFIKTIAPFVILGEDELSLIEYYRKASHNPRIQAIKFGRRLPGFHLSPLRQGYEGQASLQAGMTEFKRRNIFLNLL